MSTTPDGIDLKPDAPASERMGKRAGILAGGVLAVMVSLIIYGVLSRQGPQITSAEPPKAVTAASSAAKAINSELPDGNFALKGKSGASPSASGELKAAESPKFAIDDSKKSLPGEVASAIAIDPARPVGPREPTFEERMLAARYAQEVEAMKAGTEIRSGSAGAATARSGGGGMEQLLAAAGGGGAGGIEGLLKGLSGAGSGAGSASGGIEAALASRISALGGGGAGAPSLGGSSGDYEGQNKQGQKAEFARQTGAQGMANYLKSQRTAPLSKFEIKAGWDLPAAMEHGINSDLPGELRAMITQNVFDSATGKYLLIPQGTRVIGMSNSNVSYAQSGLQAVWTRLVFPDSSSMDLGSMVGQDQAGFSGLRDEVDNHWMRVIGAALLSSVFTAAYQISQGVAGATAPGGAQSSQQILSAAAGADVSRVGSEIVRRNLNIQPTIVINPGYKFNIRVNRDMGFQAPYRVMMAGG